MYDGIDADAATIHKSFPGAAMVAGYIDGRYVWTAADWNLFPHAVKVEIAVSSDTNTGDVIDCETGDANEVEAAAWVRKRKAAGYYRPTIYCPLSLIPAVRQATGDLVLGRDYDIWCADYDGTARNVYALAAAKQYRNTADWDVSEVYDDGWPHRSAPSAPPAAAVLWPASTVLREGAAGAAVLVLQTALRDSGIYGVRGITADGVFGPQTLTSVRNFQAYKHLTVDGIAGPQTRTALGVKR
jgi:hypothetical protein